MTSESCFSDNETVCGSVCTSWTTECLLERIHCNLLSLARLREEARQGEGGVTAWAPAPCFTGGGYGDCVDC